MPEFCENGEHEYGHAAADHEEGRGVRLQTVRQVHSEYTYTKSGGY